MQRRQLLALLAASPLASAASFWDRKPATAWSTEEILQITTRSPWAHETNLDFEFAEGGHLEVPGSGSPYGGADGSGRGAAIERPAGVMKRAPVVVRWESSQAIRDALLAPLPKAFEGHYVISVSNIPPTAMLPEKRLKSETAPVTLEAFLEDLQAAAVLEAPGKSPAGAGMAKRLGGSESTYLFGFSKELLPLSAKDKEVLFTLHTRRVSVKAKFQPKEMIYRGALAL